MPLDEVKAFFMQEVPVVASGDVNLVGWTAAPANVHDGPSSSKPKLATSASLADHSNPMWIAINMALGGQDGCAKGCWPIWCQWLQHCRHNS